MAANVLQVDVFVEELEFDPDIDLDSLEQLYFVSFDEETGDGVVLLAEVEQVFLLLLLGELDDALESVLGEDDVEAGESDGRDESAVGDGPVLEEEEGVVVAGGPAGVPGHSVLEVHLLTHVNLFSLF